MTTKKQLKKEIKILEKLRDKALLNSERLEFLFARNMAKEAHKGFVEMLKEMRAELKNL